MTHRFEYTPGIGAPATDMGEAPTHLSGIHSKESEPHISGSRLDARVETIMFVFFGMGISSTSRPSRPLMGFESGITVSAHELFYFLRYQNNRSWGRVERRTFSKCKIQEGKGEGFLCKLRRDMEVLLGHRTRGLRTSRGLR